MNRESRSPYETPIFREPSESRDDEELKVPRLGFWHAWLWIAMICLFSFWVVRWVINWETTRGRVAPGSRLVWNAFCIHTGPFAGVYYWDYGDNRPNVIDRAFTLVTSRFRRGHLFVVCVVVPAFLVLVLPSTGLLMPPMRKRWRVLVGAAFVFGTGLWYFSAMISIALLS